MKKQLLLLATAAMLACGIQSCKKEDDALTCTDGSSNFPHLAVGHRVDYYITSLMYDDDTISWTVTENPSPGTYFLQGSSKNGSAEAYAIDVYWHACGRDFYSSTNGKFDQQGHWWFSLDASVGDTWTRKLDGSTYNYRLISKNATVVTYGLGQTFTDCYKFTYNKSGSFNVDTIYVKPEIGIVDYEGFVANYEYISKNF